MIPIPRVNDSIHNSQPCLRCYEICWLSQATGTRSDGGVRILSSMGGLEEAANLTQGVASKRKEGDKQDCFLLFN